MSDWLWTRLLIVGAAMMAIPAMVFVGFLLWTFYSVLPLWIFLSGLSFMGGLIIVMVVMEDHRPPMTPMVPRPPRFDK